MTTTVVKPVGTTALDILPRPKLRDSTEIQGNILAAFNKDHLTYLYVRFPDAQRGRAWIAGMLNCVSVTKDVEDFNEQFSVARSAFDIDPGFTASWVGMSMTYEGLKMVAAEPAKIDEDLKNFTALREGAAKRAAANGDTGDSAPAKWKFGAPGKPVHAVALIASDTEWGLSDWVEKIKVLGHANGVALVCEDRGDTLPKPLTGHEHFGYKDGISQPGVKDFHREDPARKGFRIGHPGTALVAAGEFVFGYPAERTSSGRTGPKWLRNGSLLVVRRLRQDVAKWNKEVVASAGRMNPKIDPKLMGACLIGRHKSGEPLARPSDDRRGLGKDNNDFDYKNDPMGKNTPCASHIRKTNPRSFSNNSHRIMRRGIPYGPVFTEQTKGTDRGLIFASYGTSIEEQFEFVQQAWANNEGFAGGAAGAPTGVDSVIGPGGKADLALEHPSSKGSLTMSRFVRTTGALYALTPSISTLKLLAAGKPLPRG